jgi:hypothetical protein
MEDEGYAGYIWDRSTIKSAMIIGVVFIVSILTIMSSYEIHLNSQQRAALEEVASEILGTKVSIGGYYPQPKKNLVVLTQVRIANPPGFMVVPRTSFNADMAVTIGVIRMHAEVLAAEKKVFDEVVVSDVSVYLTVKKADANLMVLHTLAHPDADSGGGKTVIKDILMKGMVLRPRLDDPDRDYMPHDIESLRLTGIGEEQNGIPVAQAITQTLDTIYRAAFFKAASSDVMTEMSKSYLTEVATAMNLGPQFVTIAKQGSDWGGWTEDSRINKGEDNPNPR